MQLLPHLKTFLMLVVLRAFALHCRINILQLVQMTQLLLCEENFVIHKDELSFN